MTAHYDIITAIFNCNYSCNDTCAFCFNAPDINKSPEITMEEIRNNYYYIKNKYGLNHVIISGGEPSLYSHFWEMMEFFYCEIDKDVRPALNTNSLNFAREDMYEKLLQLLLKSDLPKKQLSLSCSTVENMQNPSAKEKLKLKGLENTIKAALLSNSRIVLPVAVTKTNYEALPDIADFLIQVVETHAKPEAKMGVQLRGLFVENYMNKEQKEKTVPDFQKALPFIVLFIEKMMQSKHVRLKIFNLPLCLIMEHTDLSEYLEGETAESKVELRMRIDHKTQLTKIKPRIFLESNVSIPACQTCAIRDKCNKVQKEYLDAHYIPDLKPLKHA